MKIKKLIFLVLGLSLVISAVLFLYFDSYNYRYKQAYKLRNKRIASLDSQKRQYMFEGIYSFKNYREISKRGKNKFGELIMTTQKVFDGNCEVSFKSQKLVLICNGIREELEIFPTIYDFDNYIFNIIDWKAYYINSGNCFFNMKSIPEIEKEFYDNKISLTLSFNGFFINEAIANISLDTKSSLFEFENRRVLFKSISQRSFLLERMEQKYSSDVPDYVSNTKYPDYKYDIISLMRPSKLEKIFKKNHKKIT